MASGRFNLNRTSGSSYISYYCEWQSASNTLGNYSDISVSVYAVKSASSSSSTSGTVNTSATVAGTAKTENGVQLNLAPGGRQLLLAKSGWRVNHNTDGSKSVTISITVGGNIVGASGSSTVTLDNIPRAATLDSFVCSTAYLDGTYTYKYTPKMASYYNRLRIIIPGVTTIKTIPLGATSTSQHTETVTLTQAELEGIYNQYPAQATVQLQAIISSFSDSGYSNKIGETSVSPITLTFPLSVKPSCTFAVVDNSGLYSTFGAYVQQQSEVTITVTPSTAYSSPIKSYKITFDGKQFAAATATTTITGYGSLPITVTVTDQRGRTSSEVTSNITVLEYAPPSLTVEAYRCTSAGVRAADGAYIRVIASASISSLGNQNSATYSIKYKESDAQNWTEVTGSGVSADTCALSFDVSKTGAVEVTFTDEVLTSAPIPATIPLAFTLWEAYHTGKGISFGETATQDGFIVNMPTRFKHADFTVDAMPDYIVTSGSSSGWGYKVFKSGLVMLWKKITAVYTSSNTHILLKSDTLPVTILTSDPAPVALCSMKLGDPSNSFDRLLHCKANITSGTAITVYVVAPDGSFTSSSSRDVNVLIIGTINNS